MVSSSSLASLLALATLFALLARSLYSRIQARRFAQLHNCEPPPLFPQRENFLGWDYFRALQLAAKEKRVLELSLHRFRTYGKTFAATMMAQRSVNTIEPENVKAILATNFKDFGLGQRERALGPLLGRGIFTTDGAHWEHSRAMVRPNFTRTQVADLDTFESHIQQLIAAIPHDGATTDLQPLFFRLTLDSATEFLFGQSVHSLTAPDGSPQQGFGTAFDLAQSKLGHRIRLGKLASLHRSKELSDACNIVHEFVDAIVSRALARTAGQDPEKRIEGKDDEERYVFLNELVRATRDPKRLRDELLNILLAGRDTTASLLSNTFHVLARRPDIWQKLKAEVDELNGARPSYETLRGMRYLKCLLNESLRLYPVVPGNARFAVRDTTLPTGGGPSGTSPIFIPAGTVVAYSVYSMHRRTDIYGADAADFRPERWLPEEGLRPGWAYLPFNGGPRICVGQQFALTEASYTVVRLCQEFEALQNRDDGVWREQLGLTLASAEGVKVGLWGRKEMS